jgi:two-component system response regulator DesR
MSGTIRLLLADDQALVRGALAALLGLETDLDVVAQVGRGDEVVAAALQHHPHVALLDVDMPGLDGIAATHALRKALPACRVLVVTTFGRPGYLRRAMEAGASGFLVKDTPSAQLADAVRRIAAGLRVVDPILAVESLMVGQSPLTERQQDVLRVAAGGGTVADIARATCLGEGTVRNYLSAAMSKTGARTHTDAVRIAENNGWLLGESVARTP